MTQPDESRTDFDPTPILRVLAEHDVDCVVIGGLAGNIHGSARATYDVDIVYSREQKNLERLAEALRDLDARLSGPNVPPDLPFRLDAETLRRGANCTFDTRHGRFDILAEPQGAPAYDELRRAARDAEVGGVEIRAASLDHLIAMKRASGREKDRGDIAEYTLISDELQRRGN